MDSNSVPAHGHSSTTLCSTTRNVFSILRRGHGQEIAVHLSSQRSTYSNRYIPFLDTLWYKETDKANEQHYQVSSKYFECCLGPRLKYSCCLYPCGKETLEQAETEMLESYVDKAGLTDGMELLDLGCGWGSLSLFLAEVWFSFSPYIEK